MREDLPSVAHVAGAAKRRRERRLRQFLRHERLTVAILLAESQHHAAPRGQSRSGGWERDVHGQVPEHPTPQVACTQHFAMDVDEVPATGSRPDRLAGVRPQERVQQHPVDQIVDTALALPILDVLVPLMGEQLVDVLRFLDTLCLVAEQVIDVPKIPLENIPARRLCREPQLVEVLTVVSYSSLLQRTVEQHVDIPVPGRGGRLAGLQGSLPGQSSTAPSVEQIVHIPGGGQHFQESILNALRDLNAADLCRRQGFRGGPLLDFRGSMQLLDSSHVRDRDKALLRAILSGGVWNGFLLGNMRRENVPCRFCGGPDGDGHLFCCSGES